MSNQRLPVLMVHGLNDTTAIFDRLAPYLKQQGWSIYDINLIPSNGDLTLQQLALQLEKSIAQNFAPNQYFDLIGLSMGGSVSRYYLQRMGGIRRVKRFITLGSPHHGTVTAYLSQRPGCLQMRPDSDLIQDLNSDAEMLKQINFTSIWTPFDLMIVPAISSQMPVGQSIEIPVLSHAWISRDKRSIEAVAEALSAPVK